MCVCVCVCIYGYIFVFICIWEVLTNMYLGGADEIFMKKLYHLFLACLTGQFPRGHIFHVEKEYFYSILIT